MTNLEALQSLTGFDIPNLHIKVLEDQNITPNDTYTGDNSDIIELCSAYFFKALLTHPNFAEGKLSVNFDRKYIEKVMNAIFKKNGIDDEVITKTAKIRIQTL